MKPVKFVKSTKDQKIFSNIEKKYYGCQISAIEILIRINLKKALSLFEKWSFSDLKNIMKNTAT